MADTDETSDGDSETFSLEAIREQWGRYLWALVPLSILLGDMVFRWGGGLPGRVWSAPLAFVSSILFSTLLWWSVSRLIGDGRWRWLATAGCASIGAALTLSQWAFHQFAGQDIVTGSVVYAWKEPMSAWDYVSQGASPLLLLAFLAMTALWTFALAYRTQPLRRRRRLWYVLFQLPFWVAVGWWPLGIPFFESTYVSDLHTAQVVSRSVHQIAVDDDLYVLGIPNRVELQESEPRERPNVLVFMAESLQRTRMGIYGHDRPTTPKMQRFLDRHEKEVHRFERAHTTSGAPVLSIPSLLTGKYMAHSRETMHQRPVLWQFGEAAGMHTFLISPQDWSWHALHDFFLVDAPPDHVATASHFDTELVNDMSIHDRVVADYADTYIREKLPDDAPFMGVVQSNSAHFPFLPKEDVPWEIDSIEARYEASVAMTDLLFGRTIEALREKGELEDTIIVFANDHGEFLYSVDSRESEEITETWHDGLRVDSCHPRIVQIPMFLYVPERWRRRLDISRSALETNEERVVSSVDVVPTLVDALSLSDVMDSVELEPFDGRSLLERIPRSRHALCTTRPPWNMANKGGIGIFGLDRIAYFRRDFQRMCWFDPKKASIWEERAPGHEATRADREWFREVLEREPVVKRYFEYATSDKPLLEE